MEKCCHCNKTLDENNYNGHTCFECREPICDRCWDNNGDMCEGCHDKHW